MSWSCNWLNFKRAFAYLLQEWHLTYADLCDKRLAVENNLDLSNASLATFQSLSERLPLKIFKWTLAQNIEFKRNKTSSCHYYIQTLQIFKFSFTFLCELMRLSILILASSPNSNDTERLKLNLTNSSETSSKIARWSFENFVLLHSI